MRRAALCVVLLCLTLPARAGDDPFADFRIPAHQSWSGDASLSFSASRDITSNSPSGATNGSGSGRLIRRGDSDPLRYQITLGLGGQLGYQRLNHRDPDPSFGVDGHERQQRTQESWSLAGSVAFYPWWVPLGLELSASTRGDYGQGWYESVADYRQPPGAFGWTHLHRYAYDATHGYANASDYSVTPGLGRVRDATVVYRVHVLEGRLLATGALTRPLTRAARERLAALMVLSLDGSLSVAHERPSRYFWREVERVMREDGALAGEAMDAWSLARVMEGVDPGGYLRRERGWFIGPTVSGSHTHLVARDDYHSVSRYEEGDSLVAAYEFRDGRRRVGWTDVDRLGGRAEFHRPLGWSWQLDITSSLLRPLTHTQHGLSAYSSVMLSWDRADRWMATGGLRHRRSYFRDDHYSGIRDDEWAVDATASVGFHLEDRTLLSLSMMESQTHDISSYARFHRTSSLYLSLSHRFLGTLEAPGILEPQRLAD